VDQATHLVSPVKKLANNSPAEKAGGAGYQNNQIDHSARPSGNWRLD
jgi:hypothetical protein